MATYMLGRVCIRQSGYSDLIRIRIWGFRNEPYLENIQIHGEEEQHDGNVETAGHDQHEHHEGQTVHKLYKQTLVISYVLFHSLLHMNNNNNFLH